MKTIDEMTSLDWWVALYGVVWRFILMVAVVVGAFVVIGEARIERTADAVQKWTAEQGAAAEKWIKDGQRR